MKCSLFELVILRNQTPIQLENVKLLLTTFPPINLRIVIILRQEPSNYSKYWIILILNVYLRSKIALYRMNVNGDDATKKPTELKW